MVDGASSSVTCLQLQCLVFVGLVDHSKSCHHWHRPPSRGITCFCLSVIQGRARLPLRVCRVWCSLCSLIPFIWELSSLRYGEQFSVVLCGLARSVLLLVLFVARCRDSLRYFDSLGAFCRTYLVYPTAIISHSTFCY